MCEYMTLVCHWLIRKALNKWNNYLKDVTPPPLSLNVSLIVIVL